MNSAELLVGWMKVGAAVGGGLLIVVVTVLVVVRFLSWCFPGSGR